MRARNVLELRRLLSQLLPSVSLCLACGAAERATPVDDRLAPPDADAERRAHLTAAGSLTDTRASGTLIVVTHTGAPSYLGSVHVVARDAEQNILAGADEDRDSALAGTARGELSLSLPAGEGYAVSLDARTTQPAPSECHASVAPVQVEAGESARLQVLSWQCGDRTGYVPPAVDSGCYWLVDWLSASRSTAALGKPVALRLERSAELAPASSVTWQVEPASAGHFSRPSAAETSFVCDAPSPVVSVSASVALGDCVERLTQAITCTP